MDTWRECERTGDALFDHEDEDGSVLPIRVPWESRSHWLGWGRRRRATWTDSASGEARVGVILSEGEGGVLARDEHGTTYALPVGSFDAIEWPAQAKPLRKATRRVWVAQHAREGATVAGHWRQIEHGQTYPAPAQHGGDVHIAEDDGTTATVQHQGGQRVRMPSDSVPHYIHDLSETIPPSAPSGDRAVDSVTSGTAKRIAKGNDGIVYRAATGEAVKVSTTVPFQPHNAGHRTPEGAVAHLRSEHDAHTELHGLPHVPRVRGVEHDGRYYLVKPWAPEDEHYSRAELESVAKTIAQMHQRGWVLNDAVQIGRDSDGNVWLTDLGQAHRSVTVGAVSQDNERVNRMFKAHGYDTTLKGDELHKRYRDDTARLRHDLGKAPTPAAVARYASWKDHHDQVSSELLGGDLDDDAFEAAMEKLDAHEREGKEIREAWAASHPEMAKAAKHPDPPPGSRWITVHPHGPGTEGQPILISPEPDGTFRVIGGAGGSMNHLKLRDVASEEEMRDRAATRRKEKAARERDRRKALTPEERQAEDRAEIERKNKIRAAERHVIELVREKRGGVDKDLTEDDLAGLSDRARQKLEDQHHRKQLRQAMKARRDIATLLASEQLERIEDEAAVEATIREDADLWTEAQELGARELALIEAEDEARRANRRPVDNRADGDARREAAGRTATEVLATVDRDEVEAELERLGGRAEGEGALPAIVGETASEEQRRRAALAKADALILAEAAGSEDPSADAPRAAVEFEVVARALREAGVDPAKATDEEMRTALANEAAIALQRAQLAELKARKFEAMEAAGKAEQAMKAQVHGDVIRGLSAEVREATTRLGLRDDAKTPLRTAEVAELVDVLSSFEALRDAKKGLDEVEAIEKKGASYDKSRRAFNLAMSDLPDHVVETVQEQVLRELAQRIVGMADTKSSDHAKAVADGHFAKLADISLSVSNANHVDRTVVDALGLKSASHLLAHALEREGHDRDALHNALVGHHVREQAKLTTAALRQADAAIPNLEQEIASVGDVEHAMRSLDAAEADIAAAQRAVGAALGQMECTATLAQALRGKPPEHLTIELRDSGTSSVSSHLTWLASVGLGPDDYEIDLGAKEIRIPKASWDKLLNKETKETVEARKLSHAIKRGEHDEEGWLPQGMVSRSSTSFTDPPADAPRYHRPLDLHADDIVSELRDHIGARLANGERPSDIQTDLLSPTVAGKSADAESFTELVQELFPLTTEEDQKQEQENARIRRTRESLTEAYNAARQHGDDARVQELAEQIAQLPKEKEVTAKRDIHFADHYNEMAQQYLKRYHPDATHFHAESLYGPHADESQVRESVFRALASNPEHVAAFTPHGELTPDHRKALQDYFYKRAGIAETRDWSSEFGEAAAKAIEKAKEGKAKESEASQAAAGMMGLFGGGAPAGPKPKAEELSMENFGAIHPEEAKALALEYPREGRAMFMQAMGERPAEPTGPNPLSADFQRAIDAIRERKPSLQPADLARQAALHLGREKALAEAGVTEDDLRKIDPATGEVDVDARRLAAKIATRSAELQPPGVNPKIVQEHYGPAIYDAEVADFESVHRKHSTPWASFVDFHGGQSSAYAAIQAEMRGEFAQNLSEHYGKITGKGLQKTIAEIPNADLHAAAITSPAGRKELAEERRKEIQASRVRGAKGERDAAGNAIGGRFQGGSATERYKAKKDEVRSHSQRQSGLFSAAAAPEPGVLHSGPDADRDPRAGERLALGDRIEKEVQAIVGGNLGHNMDPKKAVRLFSGASMDGRRIHQQRVIKMLRKGIGRVGAWLGTGSGKTPTSIGAFTDLHATGDTTHGLFLVPTAVQSQFGEEMLSFTEPGKYRFETGEGKGHAERAALLRDKGTHMRVMTHQSAARTVLRMAADHEGVAPEVMLERLRTMNDRERATSIRAALDAHGVPKHYTYVDEAHTLTTRQGEKETDTSIIIGALSHPVNSTHALFGTATPHKNDTSEVYSMARLLHPDRYSDAYRFTQSYGVGSVAAPDAIRRELDQLTYTASIPPDGVSRLDTANPRIVDGQKVAGGDIQLHPEHEKAVGAVTDAYERANAAYRNGGVDVEATKALAPARFEGVDEKKHEAIARELAPSLGIVKETAIRKALQLAPIEHNEKLKAMADVVDHDTKAGKQSIIFTDSLEEAKHVHATLAAQGHAVGIYHGGLDGKARDTFREQYKQGQIKIGIMTSAGEAGINMQTGKVVHHYDVPKTMKSWSQRNGRAFRQGQKDDVDVHDWTHAHDFDQAGVRRLQDKAALADVFQTPLGPLDEHGFAKDYHDALNAKHAAFDVPGKAPRRGGATSAPTSPAELPSGT